MSVVIHGWGQMGKAFALSQKHQDVVINPTPFDNDAPVRGLYDPKVSNLKTHVMGVSSLGIPWFLEQISSHDQIDLIVLTKGLIAHHGKLKTLTSYLDSHARISRCIFVSGPCLASDLMNQNAVTVNFSCKDPIDDIITKFQTDTYSIVALKDVKGCQWLAALKNVYAIICAYALSQSKTQGAVVFQNSLNEMRLWLSYLNADENTVMSLSGVGDLFVTIQGGRNGRFGSYLAQGMSSDEIQSGPMKGVTVEGLNVIELISQYPEQFNTIIDKLPLYRYLLNILG